MRRPNIVIIFSLLLMLAASASAQYPSEGLPRVIQHEEPQFPVIARTAHVSGEVRVRITTDGESVTKAVAESGPPLLHKAVEDNVRTWKFVPHTPGTFEVAFEFRFLTDKTTFLQEPGVVDVAVSQVALFLAEANEFLDLLG